MPDDRTLDLAAITESAEICLTPGFRSYLREAAQFCLDHNGHATGAALEVDGSSPCRLSLRWAPLADARRSWNTFADTDEAAEHGAYGLAFALVLALTGHGVVERSAKGTGFDFWLGERGSMGFQQSARLEVSGILADPARIASRTQLKIAQTERSDGSHLPAFVVVVEFSRPASRMMQR